MTKLFALVLVVALNAHAIALAGGTCSGVKGGCGRSGARVNGYSGAYSGPTASSGTVKVKGYYRKDGTYVRAHERRRPGTAGDAAPAQLSPLPLPAPRARTEARTAARTKARTQAWNGNVTDTDDESITPIRELPVKAKLRTRFKIYFANGNSVQVAGYARDGEEYIVYSPGGGRARHGVREIRKIEALPGTDSTTTDLSPFRIWKTDDGKFSVEARFVGESGDKVLLEKRDEKIIEVEKDRLSDEDREWLRLNGLPGSE